MIGIIGAMDEEIKYIKEQMVDISKYTYSSIDFFVGNIGKKDIVLVKSLIGKANSAMAATILVEKFDINSVINIGSAGGLKDNCEISDIVIASDVLFHDVDVRCFGYEMGQVPNLPTKFTADSNLVKLAVESVAKVGLTSHIGLIISGDQFIHRKDQFDIIKENFPEAIASEMEAASIGLVMRHYKIPFVILRSLSDIAGTSSDISFDQYLDTAAKNSSKVLVEMLVMI